MEKHDSYYRLTMQLDTSIVFTQLEICLVSPAIICADALYLWLLAQYSGSTPRGVDRFAGVEWLVANAQLFQARHHTCCQYGKVDDRRANLLNAMSMAIMVHFAFCDPPRINENVRPPQVSKEALSRRRESDNGCAVCGLAYLSHPPPSCCQE